MPDSASPSSAPSPDLKKLLDSIFTNPEIGPGLTHRTLARLLTARNYQATNEGVCYGYANVLALSNLATELMTSKERIHFIHANIIKNHREAYALTENYFQTPEGQKKLIEKTSERDKGLLLAEYYGNMQNNLLERDTNHSTDIHAYFDSIATIQSPSEHGLPVIHDSEGNMIEDSLVVPQDVTPLLPIISPVKLEELGGACALSSLGAVFDEQQLTKFLDTLKPALISNSDIPLSFTISSYPPHCIFLGYDPQYKQWAIGNANDLPDTPIFYLKYTAQVAQKIINSFQRMTKNIVNPNVAMNIRLLALRSHEKELTLAWNSLQNDFLKTLSSARLKIRDGAGKTCLDHSMQNHSSEWAINLLQESRLNLDQLTDNPKVLNRALHVNIHPDVLKNLLAKSDVTNLPDKTVNKLLKLAIDYDQKEKLDILLTAGINPNRVDNDDVPLIFSAVKSSEMLEAFLKSGSDPNTTCNNYSLLLKAINQENISDINLLIQYKADVNSQTSDAISPLAYTKKLSIKKLLLENGADPNLFNKDGKTELHHAITSQNLDYCMLLIQYGADLNASHPQADYLTPAALLNKADNRFKKEFIARLDALAKETIDQLKGFIATHPWDISFFQRETSSITLNDGKEINVPKHVKQQWDEIIAIEQKSPRAIGDYWAAYQKVSAIGKQAAQHTSFFRAQTTSHYYELFQKAAPAKIQQALTPDTISLPARKPPQS